MTTKLSQDGILDSHPKLSQDGILDSHPITQISILKILKTKEWLLNNFNQLSFLFILADNKYKNGS